MDEGVVDILIYLLLTSPAEQSTRWVGGVAGGRIGELICVVRFIFSHVQRYYNDRSCGRGGRGFCCHIGLGAVDPNHDLTASPWLLSTVCRTLRMENGWIYTLSAA